MLPSKKKNVRFALPDAFTDDRPRRHQPQWMLSDAVFGIMDDTPDDEREDPYSAIADRVLAQLVFANTIPSPARPNSNAGITSTRSQLPPPTPQPPTSPQPSERVLLSPRSPEPVADSLPVFLDSPPSPIELSSGESSPMLAESHRKLPDIQDVDMADDTDLQRLTSAAIDAISRSSPRPPSVCDLEHSTCVCRDRLLDRMERCREMDAVRDEIHFVHGSVDAIQDSLGSMGVELQHVYRDSLTDIALFSERMGLDIGRFTTDVPAADWNRMFSAGIRQAAAHFFDASEHRRDLLEFQGRAEMCSASPGRLYRRCIAIARPGSPVVMYDGGPTQSLGGLTDSLGAVSWLVKQAQLTLLVARLTLSVVCRDLSHRPDSLSQWPDSLDRPYVGASHKGPTDSLGGPTDSLGGPTDSLGGPTDSLGGPTDSLGGPTDSLGGPTHLIGGPTHSVGGPTHSVGGPTHSLGGPTHSLGGPTHSLGGPTHSLGGPTHSLGGPTHLIGGMSVYLTKARLTLSAARLTLSAARLTLSVARLTLSAARLTLSALQYFRALLIFLVIFSASWAEGPIPGASEYVQFADVGVSSSLATLISMLVLVGDEAKASGLTMRRSDQANKDIGRDRPVHSLSVPSKAVTHLSEELPGAESSGNFAKRMADKEPTPDEEPLQPEPNAQDELIESRSVESLLAAFANNELMGKLKDQYRSNPFFSMILEHPDHYRNFEVQDGYI
ncbi:hypothetical protein EV363DRAFT_1298266 [Boletus edulis]|nr:hypothetical protein EV363DRAFT_1298266 [Boletus edulis]